MLSIPSLTLPFLILIAHTAMAILPVVLSLLTISSISLAQQTCTPSASQVDITKYPPAGQIATTNTLNTPEFQALMKSIDWSKVPQIPPKKWTPQQVAITTGYDVNADPDCWWSVSTCTTPKHQNINPDIRTCPEPGTWGLTYDDGPYCGNAAFYDFLKQNNQKASLYYIGTNVINWPNEAKRGYTDGHHINGHTWSHKPMTNLTNEEVLAELYYTQKIIKEVTGVTPLYWRPPFGDIDDRVRAIATQLNLTATIWNLDTNDWNMAPAGALTPAQIDANFQGMVNQGKNGTYSTGGVIVLQHELNDGTIGMAQKWLPQVKQAFGRVVPVATCMNISKPYMEDVKYQTFAEMVGGKTPNATTTTKNNGTITGVPVPVGSTPTVGANQKNTTNTSGAERVVMSLVVGGVAVFVGGVLML